MSFSMNASGTKEEALAQLAAASGHGDTQHFEACRDALRAAIESAPEGSTVNVNASGHHDYGNESPFGDFQLSFSARKAAAAPEATPEPEAAA